MNFYRAFGLRIQSDHPVPEFRAEEPGAPDLVILWHAEKFPDCGGRYLRIWGEADDPWRRVARIGGGYLIGYRKADFWLSLDGSCVLCRPNLEVPFADIRRLFLVEILPIALDFRGNIVLHASAVQTAAGAIAFGGPSGDGKSTLACHFAAQGYPLLTDDVLAVGFEHNRYTVFPGYPGVRLCADSYKQCAAISSPAHA